MLEKSSALARITASLTSSYSVEELYGAAFARLCEELAGQAGCHPAILAGPLRTALATFLGRTAVVLVDPGRGWKERVMVWSIVVAESGQKKSVALRKKQRMVASAEASINMLALVAGYRGPVRLEIMRKSVSRPLFACVVKYSLG